MGLDMYLTRKIYIGANYDFNKITGNVEIMQANKKIPIELDRITHIEEDAGYWRKANQIHKWFVDNIQQGNDDCKNYYVSIDKLKELLELCKEIKEKAIIKKGKIKNGEKIENGECKPIYQEGIIIENAEEIASILPTESGFFFGSTDYDEYYLYDINDTIEIIEKQIERDEELKNVGIYSYLEYSSSW